jgi:hypothetical protein
MVAMMKLFLGLLLLVSHPYDSEPEAEDTTGEKVAAFARSMLGRQVGDGQCTALISVALENAGARRRTSEGWGEPIESLDDLKPGDILTFKDAVFVRRRRLPTGGTATTTARMANHAAIVSDTRKVRGALVLAILHQNLRNTDTGETRQEVHEWFLNLGELRGGTVRAYRPVAATAETPRPSARPPEKGNDAREFRD